MDAERGTAPPKRESLLGVESERQQARGAGVVGRRVVRAAPHGVGQGRQRLGFGGGGRARAAVARARRRLEQEADALRAVGRAAAALRLRLVGVGEVPLRVAPLQRRPGGSTLRRLALCRRRAGHPTKQPHAHRPQRILPQ